jgi:hypothetical protein
MGNRISFLAITGFALCLMAIGALAESQVQEKEGKGAASVLTGLGYLPLTEDLVVVDGTDLDANGVSKRLAKKADLVFSRQLSVRGVLGVAGIKYYSAMFTLSLKNVSGRQLNFISIMEAIPAKMVPKASAVKSDQNFLVMQESPPVIKFGIRALDSSKTVSLSYSTTVEPADRNDFSEENFREMGAPAALIELEANSCLGIKCDDFDACTKDSCAGGKCVFSPMQDGESCGAGKQCVEGKCIEVEAPVADQNAGAAKPKAESQKERAEIPVSPMVLALAFGLVVVAGVFFKLLGRKPKKKKAE